MISVIIRCFKSDVWNGWTPQSVFKVLQRSPIQTEAIFFTSEKLFMNIRKITKIKAQIYVVACLLNYVTTLQASCKLRSNRITLQKTCSICRQLSYFGNLKQVRIKAACLTLAYNHCCHYNKAILLQSTYVTSEKRPSYRISTELIWQMQNKKSQILKDFGFFGNLHWQFKIITQVAKSFKF